MPSWYLNIKANCTRLTLPIIGRSLEDILSATLERRMARGVFWSLLGALILRGLNFGTMVILARMLEKEKFGEYGIIRNTLDMFHTFATFGMGWAATKYIASSRNRDIIKAGRIIAFSKLSAAGTGTLFCILFFFLAPWLAYRTLAAPHLGGLLQLSAVILLLNALTAIQTGALCGLEAFKSLARVNILGGVCAFPLITLGAYLNGIKGVVLGLVASQAAMWIIGEYALRAEAKCSSISLSYKECWKEWRIISDFGLPIILGGMAYSTGNWMCSALLVNQPGGYVEMAFYNAANQWFSLLLFLPGIVGQAVMPILSERLAAKEWNHSGIILNYSLKLNATIILPVVIIGCILSPWIMQLYGNDYKQQWKTLVVVLITAAICAIQTSTKPIIEASGRMWFACVINIGWGLIFFALTLIFVQWGSIGMALSRGIAYLICTVLALIFVLFSIKKQSIP